MANNYGTFVFPKISREYIITVPAVWDDKSQGRTQECATKAGMGDHVRIITEPEAAGIYALTSMPATILKKMTLSFSAMLLVGKSASLQSRSDRS